MTWGFFSLQSLNLRGYFYKSQPTHFISRQNSRAPMNTSHFHSKRQQRWLTRPCSLVYIRCENNWHLYSCTCSEAREKHSTRGSISPWSLIRFYSLQMWRRTHGHPSEIAGKINTKKRCVVSSSSTVADRQRWVALHSHFSHEYISPNTYKISA